MNRKYNYLKYLIHEEIYLVKEGQIPANKDHNSSITDDGANLENKTIILVNYSEYETLPDQSHLLSAKYHPC
jgi:hypothetical protein